MSKSLQLPALMEPFREKLLETKQSFVRVTAGPAGSPALWASKVGGHPYLPKGTPWPTAPDGNHLFFLAQINFSEMPQLAPFPEKGIVQFFIHNDDLYGMDFDDGENPDSFRVLFHPEPVQDKNLLESTFPPLPKDEEEWLPHHPDESYQLRFEAAEEIAGMTDYRFHQHFGGDFFHQFGEQEWQVSDEFGKTVRPQGHKIGGYAYFTQDDPRRPEDPMLLLFQLDSDEGMDLMWGDMGVGHFFIREKDLITRDFSKVLYDWDCL